MPYALEFVSGQMLLLTLITRLERLEEHKEYCVWTFWIQNTASINQHQHLCIFARSLCRSHLGIGHIYSIILVIWQFFGICMNCCVQLWGALLLPPSQDNGFENIQTVSLLFCKFMPADKFWLLKTKTF